MYAAGVGWWGSGAVNNLNSIQSNNVESRAQVTIRLSYEQIDVVEDVNNIEVILPSIITSFDMEAIERTRGVWRDGVWYGAGIWDGDELWGI